MSRKNTEKRRGEATSLLGAALGVCGRREIGWSQSQSSSGKGFAGTGDHRGGWSPAETGSGSGQRHGKLRRGRGDVSGRGEASRSSHRRRAEAVAADRAVDGDRAGAPEKEPYVLFPRSVIAWDGKKHTKIKKRFFIRTWLVFFSHLMARIKVVPQRRFETCIKYL
jgi:hypothetical protein